jgi:hypothetical protein
MARRLNLDILTRFEDGLGKWREAPQENHRGHRSCHGKTAARSKGCGYGGTARPTAPAARAARITLEDGAVLCAHDALPGDLPGGYRYLTKIAPPS